MPSAASASSSRMRPLTVILADWEVDKMGEKVTASLSRTGILDLAQGEQAHEQVLDRLLKADVVNKLAERPEKVKMERLETVRVRFCHHARHRPGAVRYQMAVDFTNARRYRHQIQAGSALLWQGLPTQTSRTGPAGKFGVVLGDIILGSSWPERLLTLAQITELNGYMTQEKAGQAVKTDPDRWQCRRCISCSGSITCFVSGHETGIR